MLIWAKGTALMKWVATLVLGALIGWFISQALSIPKHNSEIEVVKEQINSVKQQLK